MRKINQLLLFSLSLVGFSLFAQETPDTLNVAVFDSANHVWINELFSYSPCVGWGPDHKVIKNEIQSDANLSDSILQFPQCFPGGIGYVTSDTARINGYNSMSFKVYSESSGYVYAQWFRIKREDLGEEDDVKLQQVDHWIEGGKWNCITDNFKRTLSDTNQYKLILLPDYRTTNPNDTLYFDELAIMKTFKPKSLNINYSTKVIDGVYEDWATETDESLDILASGELAVDEGDFHVGIKSAWDMDYLYIYGKVTDDVIIDTIGDSWKNDALEIALNMAGNDQFHAFWDAGDPPDNAKIVITKAIVEGIGTLTTEDITIERTVFDSGWEFELKVPLKGIYADFSAQGGTFFNMGIQAADNDDGINTLRKIRWAGTGHINKTVPNSTVTLVFNLKKHHSMFSTILVDGDFSDWNEKEAFIPQILTRGYMPSEAGDFETSMKLAWDVSNLYLYGEMIDQTNIDTFAVSDMWKGDVFEVGLNMAGDDQFNVFWDPGTPPDNSKVLVSKSALDTIGAVKGADITIERMDINGGWAFEMSIPFKDLYENFNPTNGTVFNFDFQVADTDTAERESRIKWASDGNLNNTLPNSEITLAGMPIVTADGMITESDPWDTIMATPVEYYLDAANISVEDDFKAEYKMFWTDTYLSVLIAVEDDSIFTGSENIYDGDNIELYLDMNNSKLVKMPRDAGWSARPWEQNDNNDYQIRLVPGSTEITVDGEEEEITSNIQKTALVGYAETGTGYTFEMNLNIPMLTAGVDDFVAESGYVFGFDLDISDNDNDPDERDQVSWFAKSTWIWNDPSLWGVLQFDDNHMISIVNDEERPSLDDVNAVVTVDSNSVELSWSAATDNWVADDYIIFMGAEAIDTVRYKTTYAFEELDYSTEYILGVAAMDYSGNVSAKKVIEITTGADPTNGVESIDYMSLGFYPNPVIDKMYLNKVMDGKVSVFDLSGKIVYENVLNKDNVIDLRNLNKGIYSITIISEKNMVRSTFVKE